MMFKKGFAEGFLVLGFAIFILGFLAGMLAILLIDVKMDAAVPFIAFSAGLLAGVLIIALVLVTIKVRSLEESS